MPRHFHLLENMESNDFFEELLGSAFIYRNKPYYGRAYCFKQNLHFSYPKVSTTNILGEEVLVSDLDYFKFEITAMTPLWARFPCEKGLDIKKTIHEARTIFRVVTRTCDPKDILSYALHKASFYKLDSFLKKERKERRTITQNF